MGRGRRWRLTAAIALAAGSVACAQTNPRVRARNEAGARLSGCVQQALHPYRGEPARRACFDEAAAYCQDQGLEPGCALGTLWTSPASRL
jgi:hypothetical protein